MENGNKWSQEIEKCKKLFFDFKKIESKHPHLFEVIGESTLFIVVTDINGDGKNILSSEHKVVCDRFLNWELISYPVNTPRDSKFYKTTVK